MRTLALRLPLFVRRKSLPKTRGTKMKNEILDEIWSVRKDIEKEHGGDLRKVFKSMKRKTSTSKRKRYAGILRKKKVVFA
jgi:hypothetical protein